MGLAKVWILASGDEKRVRTVPHLSKPEQKRVRGKRWHHSLEVGSERG
jgi:hypothetical protein